MDSSRAPSKDFTAPEAKLTLRRALREMLAAMGPDERAAGSEAVRRALLAHPSVAGAERIALFYPMPGEPDLLPLLHAMPGCAFAFPRVEGGRIVFHETRDPRALLPGYRGIPEPPDDPATLVAPERFDLVLVPGLAFTRAGERLGRGGGFYDRFLALPGLAARRAGVCFSAQLLDALPAEPHDARVEAVFAG